MLRFIYFCTCSRLADVGALIGTCSERLFLQQYLAFPAFWLVESLSRRWALSPGTLSCDACLVLEDRLLVGDDGRRVS